jgi:hypothetical protein
MNKPESILSKAPWGNVWVPENKIEEVKPEHSYHPVSGFSASLIVLDENDVCIGWIDTRVLGYEAAREWMKAVGYKVKEHEQR